MNLFEQFPYTNFHNLNLDWILDLMKKWSGRIDGLAEEIEKAVNSALDDKNLASIVLQALTAYGLVVNVKAPPMGLVPATGDGTADDTAAIQGCINYAENHGGAAVFFPSGAYLCGPLTVKSGVSLHGESRYNTRIVLRGGADWPLISGNVDGWEISNIGLDGNAEIQVNNVNVLEISGKNILVTNIVASSGYALFVFNLSGDIQAGNIVALNATRNHIILNGTGFANFNDIICNDLSAISGISCIENHVDNAQFNGCRLKATAPVGFSNTGNRVTFVGTIDNAVTPVSNSGTNCVISGIGTSFEGQYSGRVGLTAKTASITTSGNCDKNIGGDDSSTVAGSVIKTIGVNISETISGGKEEIITNTKKVKANDIILESTNPLTYKTPEALIRNLKYVPFKTATGEVYKVLVGDSDLNIGNVLGGVKIDMWGDSIMYGTQSGGGRCEKPWPEVFAEKTGADVTNHAVGGANMSALDANSFSTIVDSLDLTLVNTVVLAYGLNDVGRGVDLVGTDKTGFGYAYRYSLDKMISKKPNIKIVLCTTPYHAGLKWEYEPSKINCDMVNSEIYKIAQEYNLPVLDFVNMSGVNEKNLDALTWDKLHPNQIGQTMMGEYAATVFPGTNARKKTSYTFYKTIDTSATTTPQTAEFEIYSKDWTSVTVVAACNGQTGMCIGNRSMNGTVSAGIKTDYEGKASLYGGFVNLTPAASAQVTGSIVEKETNNDKFSIKVEWYGTVNNIEMLFIFN